MKSAIYVAVALLAGAAGYGIYRYGIAPQTAEEAPSMAATPTPPVAEPVAAAAEPAGEEASSVPTSLPEFTLQDRNGSMRSIRSWTGKSMIVNFWATWCAPCRREIPLLQELQRTRGGDGFQVVGVAVDVRDDVLAYAKKMAIDYPLLIGEQDGVEAVTKFGLGSMGFPFTAFTDNQHRIVAMHVGELTKPQAEVLLAVVGRVNNGELTPEAARTVAAKQLEEIAPPQA